MKRNPCCRQLVVSGCLVSCFIFVAITKDVIAADKLRIKASLWQYESLCNFKEPNWPEKSIIHAITDFTLSARGCQVLERELGHPPAVLLSIENLGEQEAQVSLGSLSDVAVKSRNGTSVCPLAVVRRESNPYSSGHTIAFTTFSGIGKWIVPIGPSKTVDLVFLVPAAKVGDTITFGPLPSTKIE